MSRILMVYSHISRPNLAEARRAGVSEMVLFPFSRESFLESLDRLIGKGQKGPGPEPTAPP
jgi:hypothetical protein